PKIQEYWAAVDSTEIGEKLTTNVKNLISAKLTKEMATRWARCYSYYYGIDPSGVHGSSQVLRQGEQGELAAIRINHVRALANTLVNIVTASKATWTPKATNVDSQSIKDCELAT